METHLIHFHVEGMYEKTDITLMSVKTANLALSKGISCLFSSYRNQSVTVLNYFFNICEEFDYYNVVEHSLVYICKILKLPL